MSFVAMAAGVLGQQGGGGGGPLTLDYRAAYTSGANSTSYTFSGSDLGVAGSDRTIVVVAVSRGTGGATPASVTIGGVSATLDLSSGYVGTGNGIIIASAAVPTGTTGDVVVNWGATQLRCAIGVYRVVGAASVTATDIDRDFGTTATSLSLSPTTSGGVIIAGALEVTTTGTWSDDVTNDSAAQIGGETAYYTFGSGAVSSTTATATFTVLSSISNVAAAVAYEGA